MKKFLLFSLVITITLLISPSFGELVTVHVMGTVNSVSSVGLFSWDNSVTVGSTMTGVCCYDPDLVADQGAGYYYGKYSIDLWSMTIGNYEFKENPADLNYSKFEVWKMDMSYKLSTTDGIAILNDIPLTYGNINIAALNISSPFSGPDDKLPVSFPDISIFSYRHKFEVSFSDGITGFNLSGTIDSIAAVPEPMSILFFSVGGMVLIRKQSWKS